MAVLPEDVYNALDGVFTTYSAGKLKGQKLKISELLSGGDLKVHHLKSFAQIADPRCQLEFLKEFQRGQYTLDQFKMEAHKVKGRQECQHQFCRQVGVSTWKQATEEFPQHTSVQVMDRFHGISFRKRLPEVWTSHIRSFQQDIIMHFRNDAIGTIAQTDFAAITLGRHLYKDDGAVIGARSLGITSFHEERFMMIMVMIDQWAMEETTI